MRFTISKRVWSDDDVMTVVVVVLSMIISNLQNTSHSTKNSTPAMIVTSTSFWFQLVPEYILLTNSINCNFIFWLAIVIVDTSNNMLQYLQKFQMFSKGWGRWVTRTIIESIPEGMNPNKRTRFVADIFLEKKLATTRTRKGWWTNHGGRSSEWQGRQHSCEPTSQTADDQGQTWVPQNVQTIQTKMKTRCSCKQSMIMGEGVSCRR